MPSTLWATCRCCGACYPTTDTACHQCGSTLPEAIAPEGAQEYARWHSALREVLGELPDDAT